MRCLETVLLSQPGTVLTAAKCQDLRGKNRSPHHNRSKPVSTRRRALLNRRSRKVYHFDNEGEEDDRSRPTTTTTDDRGDSDNDDDDDEGEEEERVEGQASSDDDSGVRVGAGKGRRKVVVVRSECRCARITRFVAVVIDFLLDVGNLLRNFTLYRFFVGVLNGFYRLVGFLGRWATSGGAQNRSDDDDTLRKLAVGVV